MFINLIMDAEGRGAVFIGGGRSAKMDSFCGLSCCQPALPLQIYSMCCHIVNALLIQLLLHTCTLTAPVRTHTHAHTHAALRFIYHCYPLVNTGHRSVYVRRQTNCINEAAEKLVILTPRCL